MITRPIPRDVDPRTALQCFVEALAGWFRLRIIYTIESNGVDSETIDIDRRKP